MALTHNTLDLSDSVKTNADKIARQAWERLQKDHTPAEAIAEVIEAMIYNGLIDDELQENILVSVGQTFDLKPVNIQYDFNGAEE